jgi:hypothetical protein
VLISPPWELTKHVVSNKWRGHAAELASVFWTSPVMKSLAADKAGLAKGHMLAVTCGSTVMLLQCVINEYNPSVYKFNVADVDLSYRFRPQHSNHHQAVYQQYRKEIMCIVPVCKIQRR